MDKLIRDKYDSIIEKDKLYIETDSSKKFILYANKIREELTELAETAYNDPEEYADVIEAIYAMAEFQGVNRDLIEQKRHNKLNEKGAFSKCLVLKD